MTHDSPDWVAWVKIDLIKGTWKKQLLDLLCASTFKFQFARPYKSIESKRDFLNLSFPKRKKVLFLRMSRDILRAKEREDL